MDWKDFWEKGKVCSSMTILTDRGSNCILRTIPLLSFQNKKCKKCKMQSAVQCSARKKQCVGNCVWWGRDPNQLETVCVKSRENQKGRVSPSGEGSRNVSREGMNAGKWGWWWGSPGESPVWEGKNREVK